MVPHLHDPAAKEFHLLAVHKIDIMAKLVQSNQVFFICDHPLAIEDPLWSGPNEPDTLETYVWHNHSSKKLRGVTVLLHLKCEMCRVLKEAIWDWCACYPNQQYKVSMEVKVIFKKVLHA